jgi:hypothetical protein
LGGTSTSGAIVLLFARNLEAGKVIECARNVAAMEAIGFDGTIGLESPTEKE